jgi:lysylphosphatidylglycerol synthetase-like protein (DUF2156 family)
MAGQVPAILFSLLYNIVAMGVFSTILELYGTIAIIYLIALLVIAFQPAGHLSSQVIINNIIQALFWPLEVYRYFTGR